MQKQQAIVKVLRLRMHLGIVGQGLGLLQVDLGFTETVHKAQSVCTYSTCVCVCVQYSVYDNIWVSPLILRWISLKAI